MGGGGGEVGRLGRVNVDASCPSWGMCVCVCGGGGSGGRVGRSWEKSKDKGRSK